MSELHKSQFRRWERACSKCHRWVVQSFAFCGGFTHRRRC